MVKRRFVNPIQSNIQKKPLTEAEKQTHPLEQVFRSRFHFDPLVILENLKPQLERLQSGENPEIENELKDLLEEIEIIKAAHARGESDFVAYKIFILGARANGLNFFAPIKEFFSIVDDAERAIAQKEKSRAGGAKGGSRPKHQEWGDLVARELLKLAEGLSDDTAWAKIPNSFSPWEFQTDEYDINIYVSDDNLIAVDQSTLGEYRPIKKSTFLKNYYRPVKKLG